jgi:hypothetical protein
MVEGDRLAVADLDGVVATEPDRQVREEQVARIGDDQRLVVGV